MNKTRILVVLAAIPALAFAGEATGCWGSNEFGGTLVCGTATNYHAATAEEIKRDQEYYQYKYSHYDLMTGASQASLEESLVGLDPAVAARIRSVWSSVQNRSEEKVSIYLDAQQSGGTAPVVPKK